jgi:phospholipid/cholesterol/gamma-HCH transport system ATP-binding protein
MKKENDNTPTPETEISDADRREESSDSRVTTSDRRDLMDNTEQAEDPAETETDAHSVADTDAANGDNADADSSDFYEQQPDPEPTADTNVQPDEAASLAAEKEIPVITIRGIRKAFGEHEVLRGVDLHVNKGENLVILGKSGTGKSVLIKCLVGLEWPDDGTIDIYGQNISTLNYGEMNALRLKVGFLFQNSALYDSMTVRENLAFPLRQHMKKMPKDQKDALIMEMLDNVGLPESIDQLPSKLSGGQNKRIGLARTLILRPEIMLYDEPTTGLDTGTAKEISELICQMKKKYNMSSITITHDMACAKLTADRVIMMKDGIVYAEGSYAELEGSDDEWIRTFFS